MWRELIPATRELTDNQAEATAEDVPEMEQPADKQAEAEESSAPPETFLMWLREALHEEVGEADAEGLVAAVEVILGDPEAQDTAVEVLQNGGAPIAAASLRQRWQKAIDGPVVPPKRITWRGYSIRHSSPSQLPSMEGSAGEQGEALDGTPEGTSAGLQEDLVEVPVGDRSAEGRRWRQRGGRSGFKRRFDTKHAA